jgi:L-alanine-DL-glutamate epimerase-like enolase superfamily enzyme
MKVTGVSLTPVRTTRRTGSISVHIVLKLSTDEGLVGLGEISDLDCYRMHLPDLEALQVAIERMVVGRDPYRQALFHRELFGYMPTYLRYANTYPPFQLSSQIAAGIEMALYDLAGKGLDTPVYNLLGGKVRDELEMTYPIFQVKRPDDVPRYIDYVQTLVDQGITRLRYYVGVDLDGDEGFLEALRGRFGDSIHLKGLDFQGRFYWKDMLRLYERLRPFGFDLVESVSWSEDYEGMAEVRRRVDVAVCEHISSYAQAMRMIRAGAVDVFNITHQSGGMWGAARLFALADAAGLQCLISTTQEMSIGTAAVAHLGATIPVLHFPGDAVGPLLYREDVTVERIRFDGLRLIIPDGPGLGVELDEDKLEALRGSLIEWDQPAHGSGYVGA